MSQRHKMVGQRVAPDGCELNVAELECLDRGWSNFIGAENQI